MKKHNVKVIKDDEVILTETRQGGSKAKRGEYIRTVSNDADNLMSQGEQCEIHWQIVGAKDWARYSYTIGESHIVPIYGDNK